MFLVVILTVIYSIKAVHQQNGKESVDSSVNETDINLVTTSKPNHHSNRCRGECVPYYLCDKIEKKPEGVTIEDNILCEHHLEVCCLRLAENPKQSKIKCGIRNVGGIDSQAFNISVGG